VYIRSTADCGVPCATVEAELLDRLCAQLAASPARSKGALAATLVAGYGTVSEDLGGVSDMTEEACLEGILVDLGLLP
jgi:hypothetical protein